MKISISKIIVTGDNPRQSFDEESLRRLGESIKTHGQIQPVVCRPIGDDYELVIGERRLRASALVGLETIDAEIREIDDVSANELRLIENIHREDLTDAEKGDAVYSLLATYDKYNTIKDIATTINVPYTTVRTVWCPKSRKLSNKLKECIINNTLKDQHVPYLMKYSHTIQNKLASIIIKHKISSTKVGDFTKLYDAYPKRNFDDIANEVLGIKKVTISESDLTDEQIDKIKKTKENKKSKQKEIPSDELRCIGITGSGTRCKKKHLPNKEYCGQHDPEKEKKPKPEKPFRFKKVKPSHVSYANGENEWYTPKIYIEAAQKLMKTIDIDPASSDIANQIINATTYYTIEDNGLTQEWRGNVWMNPPYSQPIVTQFCDLLVKRYLNKKINQACVLVNNATETEFYQNMMKHCKAICFIKGRVKFIDKDGKSTGAPLQGQTILYFGDNITDFSSIFSEFGVVLHAPE